MTNEHLEPHLRLTSQEVKENWQQGDYSASGYLYHLLKALKRESWSFRIESVTDFCKTWEISEASFYRAKAKLITQGRLSEKILGKIELKLTKKVVTLNSESQALNSESQALNSESQALNSESQALNSENFAGVKPLHNNGFEISPDLYSDLFRSITDLSQAERESFEHFCLLRVEELPIKPTLPKAWIQKHLNELYSQWHSKQFSSSAAPVDPDCVLPADYKPKPLPGIRTNSIDERTIAVQGVAV
ncbi:MAG: hypothetical protein ACRCZS_12900 [Chroococcidiopsis sp.]